MIDPEVMRRLDQQASLIRQLQGSLGGLRVVRGVVNTTSPTIVEGTGFTVVRNSTGHATMTFTQAFSDVPSVCFTVRSSSTVLIAQGIAAATASTAQVGINTPGGVATDAEFHFIAIGPA